MIAVFDSGYGGLTVLKSLIKELPQYDYLYLGDNARAPYGNHSPEKITEFSEQAVRYLFDQGATLIIFACNTASATALSTLQKKYCKDGKKILGVLIPVAEETASQSTKKKVGVVGTRATVYSNAYPKEIAKIDPKIKVIQKDCPLLVPLIEEGWHKKPEAISILKKYLRPLKTHNIDTLILGCTHYPLMEKEFKRIMGPKVTLLTSGPITAKSLKDYLTRHPEIEQNLSKKSKRTYLTTDDPQAFQTFTTKNLGLKIGKPKKIKLQ